MNEPVKVKPIPTHVWAIYDGRAIRGVTKDAEILEVIRGGWQRLRDAVWRWRQDDAVLFEYNFDGEAATNQRIIGHLREGRNALIGKCTKPKL